MRFLPTETNARGQRKQMQEANGNKCKRPTETAARDSSGQGRTNDRGEPFGNTHAARRACRTCSPPPGLVSRRLDHPNPREHAAASRRTGSREESSDAGRTRLAGACWHQHVPSVRDATVSGVLRRSAAEYALMKRPTPPWPAACRRSRPALLVWTRGPPRQASRGLRASQRGCEGSKNPSISSENSFFFGGGVPRI